MEKNLLVDKLLLSHMRPNVKVDKARFQNEDETVFYTIYENVYGNIEKHVYQFTSNNVSKIDNIPNDINIYHTSNESWVLIPMKVRRYHLDLQDTNWLSEFIDEDQKVKTREYKITKILEFNLGNVDILFLYDCINKLDVYIKKEGENYKHLSEFEGKELGWYNLTSDFRENHLKLVGFKEN